ncbi:MAG: class I SAM-dependent methyltransferase [Ramlibacter sp.]|nr:class I SAM-dependent methyltransferase [Ramlibacter sp.]
MPITSLIRSFANRHPQLKSVLRTLASPFRLSVSGQYRPLAPGEAEAVSTELANAWQAPSIPQAQRKGVDAALAVYRSGQGVRNFDVLVDLLRPLIPQAGLATLLEVGCSSGYHGEAFAIKSLPVEYRGCDFSPAFIDLARRLHPDFAFLVADACALPEPDASIDIVLSGCCILHVADYEKAISEAARVARHHVVFHRTPVLHQSKTRRFTKMAYGVKTLEIHFNEEELVHLMRRHGLAVSAVVTLDASWQDGDAVATKTYLCEKVAQ